MEVIFYEKFNVNAIYLNKTKMILEDGIFKTITIGYFLRWDIITATLLQLLECARASNTAQLKLCKNDLCVRLLLMESVDNDQRRMDDCYFIGILIIKYILRFVIESRRFIVMLLCFWSSYVKLSKYNYYLSSTILTPFVN